MVIKGHVYRGRKPVHWSPSSRTALAEAELEYPEGHKSRSIYVSMPVTSAAEGADADLAAALEGAAFAVWTTTPWTIPANLAVAVNDRLQYSIVQVRSPRAAARAMLHSRLAACGTAPCARHWACKLAQHLPLPCTMGASSGTGWLPCPWCVNSRQRRCRRCHNPTYHARAHSGS